MKLNYNENHGIAKHLLAQLMVHISKISLEFKIINFEVYQCWVFVFDTGLECPFFVFRMPF